MSILIPPKTPLKLALYCIAISLVVSLVWIFALGQSEEGFRAVNALIFGGVGFAYGKHHGVLPYKKAFLTCLYAVIPALLLGVIPLMLGLAAVPGNEVVPFLVIGAVIVVFLVAIQTLFNSLILAFLSQLGAKHKKG